MPFNDLRFEQWLDYVTVSACHDGSRILFTFWHPKYFFMSMF